MAAIKLTQKANKERVREIIQRLAEAYPDARCSLDFETPLELLVAAILSAQCTDERVNVVTKELFKRFKTAQDYLDAPDGELENLIRTCGFYRNKAKSIKKACATLVERFGGEIPGTMEELLQLDGVGRKTANVLLGECFGVPGIIVDTHCKRVTHRLGLTKNTDPVKIERDLMKIVPKEDWTMFSHYMVFHGRRTCHARKPKCDSCPIADLCPFPTSRDGRKAAK
ncbi:MAG: endonuclease III [Candidatus Hydrogenedentota bacterium]